MGKFGINTDLPLFRIVLAGMIAHVGLAEKRAVELPQRGSRY